MSAVVEVQERLQETIRLIMECERAAVRPNAPRSLLVQIRSLEKVKDSLEREFEKYAAAEELEICRYRLIPQEGQRPSIHAIVNAWGKYQAMFSSVYDAVKRGPLEGRTKKRSFEETDFAFGYAYSGSIGVVLTLPSRKITGLRAQDLEKTNNEIFGMAKAAGPEDLAPFVERLGVPPIVKLKDWVKAQVDFAAGAGIEWQLSSQEAAPRLLVQLPEFRSLEKAIKEVSVRTDPARYETGMLVAANVEKHTFELRLDSGEPLSGRFADAINADHTAELPKRYVAKIVTTRKITVATEREELSHFLVELGRELQI
jgi:hypothetical protein